MPTAAWTPGEKRRRGDGDAARGEGARPIALTVNGRAQTLDVDLTTPLLYVLSDDLALNGPKFGCGLGQCGACAVIVRGRAVRSCVTPVGTLDGADVTTLEGLGTVEHPHPIQEAFIEEQAAQCGFCLNGVIITAKAFIDRNPNPSDAQIPDALSTVLCRCFTHARMLRAIKRYAHLPGRSGIAAKGGEEKA
jgi:nicotinate dehydrogenase subunit A